MAKKKLTPFSKLLISGVAAVVLVGGAVASIFASQNTQYLGSQAYDSSRFRFTAPYMTPVPSAQCFGTVIANSGNYFWPNACRGRSVSGMCATVLTRLTTDEIATYKKWMSLGQPTIPGCSDDAVTPTIRPSATPNGIRMTKPVLTPYPGYVRY